MQNGSNGWDFGTRWLHLGMAMTVTFQLFISLIMEVPRPGHPVNPPDLLAFQAHRWVGLAAVIIIAVHWLWSVGRRGNGDLGHLFPWASREGRQAIRRDLSQFVRGRLPDPERAGGLAGLVHGLGFLAISFMAVSGFVLFLWGPEGALGARVAARRAGELHSLVSNLAWAYWYGHVLAALWHEIRGHRVLRGIFRLGPDASSNDRLTP